MAAMRYWTLAAALLLGGCSSDTAPMATGAALVGRSFVAQRGCPSCHDPSDGAGTLAGDLAPVKGTLAFPANLTPDRTTGIGGWADIQIVRAMRFGVDDQGQELCPTMPRFPMIGDEEAATIVSYLRSLAPVTRQIPDSNCPPIKPPTPSDMATPPRDL
jgi:hypothetical protein